jgi:hypothetical protein
MVPPDFLRRLGHARSIVVAIVVVVTWLFGTVPAMALPGESPDSTLMVDGRVRTIVKAGGNIWIGGEFTRVMTRSGSVVANVENLAVFDATTGAFENIAPRLGGSGAEVWDMDLYQSGGFAPRVVIGGKFSGGASQKKNLVVVDGKNGSVVEWYNAPVGKAVLAAPSLGRIYSGGTSLTAFAFSGNKLWTRTKVGINPSLRGHNTPAAYRDMALSGNTIWVACQCDRVDSATDNAKSLIKLNTDGRWDQSFIPQSAGMTATGIAVELIGGNLYLGAGGSDYVASYTTSGSQRWKRDTSGSTQELAYMDEFLVIGGHFVEVADQAGDGCGFRSDNPGTLDPNDECQTRRYLAAYSLSGSLQGWSPSLTGKYNGVWGLEVDGSKLHVGGEFTKVSGVKQTYYARLS